MRAEFKTAGQYVWHCHILEHEDNEMMRPYRIGPADPNAPGHIMSAGALQSDPAAETAEPQAAESSIYLPFVAGDQ